MKQHHNDVIYVPKKMWQVEEILFFENEGIPKQVMVSKAGKT